MVYTIILLLSTVACVYIYVEVRRPWVLNPAVWFVLGHLRMCLGTIPYLETDQESDVTYVIGMAGVLLFFVLGTILARGFTSVSPDQIRSWYKDSPLVESGRAFFSLVTAIIFVSVLVSCAYYYSVGYNLFIDGLKGLITGNRVDDPATARLYFYSPDQTGQYFFSGYVNQFKNTLLPLLVSYVLVRSVLIKSTRGVLVSALFIPVCVVFILGTGQRGRFFWRRYVSRYLSWVFSLNSEHDVLYCTLGCSRRAFSCSNQ